MINHKKKFLLILLILLMSYLSAERFLGIDRDYYSYLFFFEDLDFSYSGRFERGFVLFSNIIKLFFNSFWMLLFSVSIISLSIKIFLLSNLPSYFFWIVIYLLILFPVHEMTQLRACISISFAYLALYMESLRKEHVFSIFIFAIAVSFHWTVLIFSPFVLLWRYTYRHYTIYYLAASSCSIVFIILFMNKFNMLNPQVDDMIMNVQEARVNFFSIRNIIFILITFIGIMNIKRINNEGILWFYISLFGILLWHSLSSIPVFAHRLFELTIFSYFFWIKDLPRISRIISMTIFLFFGLYLFFYAIYIDIFFQ